MKTFSDDLSCVAKLSNASDVWLSRLAPTDVRIGRFCRGLRVPEEAVVGGSQPYGFETCYKERLAEVEGYYGNADL